MFWRNPRDGALLLRAFENSKCFNQVRNEGSKLTRAKKIKEIRLEEKLQFGKLVETKKEKTKRLKLVSKGKIPPTEPSKIDSELAWTLKNSIKQRLTILDPYKGLTNPVIKKIGKSISKIPDCNIQKKDNTENIVENVDSIKSKPTNEKDLKKKVETREKEKPSLPKDLLENLIHYPIIEGHKKCTIKEVDPSTILSLSSRADKSCLSYPSVTKILTATMSEEGKAVLEAWKLRMIQKLGARGFEVYQAELLGEGKILHSTIMDRLMQKQFSIPDRVKPAFSSLKEVMDTVNKVQALESHVVHSKLMYRGILDCVAVYGDELCLIDWKKSDKTKSTLSSTYDAPLQLAAYIGALNSDPNYPFQLKKGLIVVAYTSGEPATVHEITESSLQLYWELWLKRLQDYHSTNSC